MNLNLFLLILLFKWIYSSEILESNASGIIELINKKVIDKYPQLKVPENWQNEVYIKYYSEENSIKVHCPRESDAPFGRTLVRTLFKIYKLNFPNEQHIKKIKLSSQAPNGKYITALELSQEGYLKSLYNIIEDLPASKTQTGKFIPTLETSPNVKMSISSPTSISEIRAFNYPIYIFYTTDEEKLEQQGMIQLLLQLGFNVFHYNGEPPCSIESNSCSLKIPEILSPLLDKSTLKTPIYDVSSNGQVYNKTMYTEISTLDNKKSSLNNE